MDDYGDLFSATSNRQLLMNLARMDHGHPPYFFQMGQVNAAYTVSGSLGGAATYPSSDLWSATGNFGVSSSHSPTFTFVPLSGTRSTEQMIKPVAPELFNALIQQGFPVDVLMRLCVQSIEFDLGQPDPHQSISNAPAGVRDLSIFNKQIIRSDPEAGKEYEAFLIVCGFLKDLQDIGALKTIHMEVKDSSFDLVKFKEAPNLEQYLAASTKGTKWVKEGDGWHLSRVSTNHMFAVDMDNPDYAERVQALLRQPWYSNKTCVSNTLALLRKPERTGMSLMISMHSPLFSMKTAATEQRAFERLAKNRDFLEKLPISQRHPVMRLRWTQGNPDPQERVVALTYRGTRYSVADESPTANTKPPTWNRDAFFALLLLMSQSDVDVTKINYQQYLQVR